MCASVSIARILSSHSAAATPIVTFQNHLWLFIEQSVNFTPAFQMVLHVSLL